MILIARLGRLFSRKDARPSPPPAPTVELAPPSTAPPEPPPVAVAEIAPAPVPPVVQPVAAPPPAVGPVEAAPPFEAAEEDGEAAADTEETEAEDDDPFSGGELLQISLPTASSVAADRQEAERLALGGPTKVTLTDPAGPGSLAETLASLEAEGRVRSEIVDDPELGPYILYHPV